MNDSLILLFTAISASIIQASLDKAGVGRVEDSSPTAGSIALMLVSIPLTFLSNLGAIAIVVWSFFVLPWLPTLITVAAGFIGFSLACGAGIAAFRRSSIWYSICSFGIPLVLVSRLVSAVCVLLLAVRYTKSIG